MVVVVVVVVVWWWSWCGDGGDRGVVMAVALMMMMTAATAHMGLGEISHGFGKKSPMTMGDEKHCYYTSQAMATSPNLM